MCSFCLCWLHNLVTGTFLRSIDDNFVAHSDEVLNQNNNIVKVETSIGSHWLFGGTCSATYRSLWERKKEAPEDLLKKELLAKMEAHKASLKELEDQINDIGK